MDNKPVVAVLFSSDSTPQYEKDIFNVIAAPVNGKYRFRYKKEHIDVNLLNQLESKFQAGSRILLAFRTNSADKAQYIDPFIVPIRWAEIETIEKIDKIVIFKFIIKDYPTFSSDFEEACSTYESNVAFAKKYFFDNNKNDVFVTESIPDIVANANFKNTEDQERAWIRIIEALSKYNNKENGKGFFDKFFFKTIVDIPENTKTLEMNDGKSSIIKIVQYNSNEHSTKEAKVEIKYDPMMLVSAHGDMDTIECRYDIMDYTFIPQNIRQDIETQVTFIITSDDKLSIDLSNSKNQSTKIRIPIRIKPSIKKKQWINFGLSFAGAFLIGLNGIFDLFKVSIHTWLGISIFAVGSILLAISGLLSKGD